MEIKDLKPTDLYVARELEIVAKRLGRTEEDVFAEATREPLALDEIGSIVALRIDALVEQEV